MASHRHLVTLRAQYRSAVGQSRTAHGKWAKAHRSNDMALRHKTYVAWEAKVARATQLAKFIQEEEAALSIGATTASLNVAKAIAIWEGGRGPDGRFHPYTDVVGVWTIGYGHTSADGAPYPGPSTPPLTGVEATTLLLHDLNHFYAPAVASACKGYGLKCTQPQFDSLVDFGYNLGSGYFAPNHDVGHYMEGHNLRGIAQAMLAYDHTGGSVNADLQRRRQWDARLLTTGSYANAG